MSIRLRMVQEPLQADFRGSSATCVKSARADICAAANNRYSITSSARASSVAGSQAERLRSLEVDDKLELRWLPAPADQRASRP